MKGFITRHKASFTCILEISLKLIQINKRTDYATTPMIVVTMTNDIITRTVAHLHSVSRQRNKTKMQRRRYILST